MAESSQRVAVVDIGSNSTRLLVADVDGGVEVLERQSRVTRLGRGVDLSGQLADEAIEAACAAIGDYIEICGELGAGNIAAIATSAVRDASNGAAFVAELRERFALSASVLDGEEEARLTYRGATAERPPEAPTLVIDIGGGSTEMVVGSAVEIGLDPYDPARVHGHLLLLETIQRELSRFSSVPLAERAEIVGLHPDRAPTIIAGCVILIEAMRAFGLDRVQASEHDILYGKALDAASRAGKDR